MPIFQMTGSIPMSRYEDQEFQPPPDKNPVMYDTLAKPTSKLSITSLVSAILGLTFLPVIGAIIAVATGHVAMGEIRESGGRLEGKSLAKAGLILGYLQIALAVIAGLIILLVFVFAGAVVVQNAQTPAATPVFDSAGSERGVKMVNEMSREDFKLIEDSKIDVNEGEIIACYNAGASKSDPEFALLTTNKIVYLKDGRTTVFDLKDITSIKDDLAFEQAYNTEKDLNNNTIYHHDAEIYHIEVQSGKGPRMRIDIVPPRGGALFYDALKSAMQGAGLTLTPTSAF
jgi:hypothetical protein